MLQERFLIIQRYARISLNFVILYFAFSLPFSYMHNKKVVTLMLFLWVLSLDYKRAVFLLKSSRPFQILCALSTLIFLSYLWSDPYPGNFYGESGFYIKNYLYYFLLPALIIATALEKRYVKPAIVLFLLSMAVNAAISYGIMFEWWSVHSPVSPKSSPQNPIPFQSSHIPYSTFLALGVLLGAYYTFTQKKLPLRVMAFLAFSALTILLFSTSGRTGQAALLGSSALLSVLFLRHYLRYLFIALGSVAVVFLAAYGLNATFEKRVNLLYKDVAKVVTEKNFQSSVGTRIAAYYIAPYLINPDNLLFGTGIGDKERYVKKTALHEFPYKVKNFRKHGRLHNAYIEMLVANGAVGLLLYLGLFYSLLRQRLLDMQLRFVTAASMLVVFFAGFSGDIFFFFSIKLLFGFFLGLSLAWYYGERGGVKPQTAYKGETSAL